MQTEFTMSENNKSLDSLIVALKQLSKRHDGNFYPPACYYMFLRWAKLAKRGAIFKYDAVTDKMTWDLLIGETEENE
jgi:hypothetical protein